MIFLLISACENKKNEKKEFEMYQMSEMALLMEKMYQDHLAIKEKVMSGEDLGDFPQNYLDIHTAKFTDESFEGNAFTTFANSFIEIEKKLFAVDSTQQKQVYSNAIQSCIMCHENVGCPGPLVRIKQLKLP